MLKRFQVGVSLVRHLGPGWAWSRVRQAVETRLGLLERRMPCQAWEELPLAGFLADAKAGAAEAYVETRRRQPVRFFFDPSDRPRCQDILRGFDAGTEGPVPRAEALLSGVLRHFECHDLEVGFPPDWFRNPFTGERLASDCHWSRVPTFAAGDIKCVWEASRFGFSYLLVRAYWRTGDERFAEGFWRTVEDWRLRNPPNSGPNWKCGQETAFRLMAWLFGAYGVADARATTPARWAIMAQMIAVSVHRIEAHLEYALSQENNHGISEATALWTAGTLFPEFKRAPLWEALGRRWLERLAQDLIYDDGGFSQHSVNYHRVMLHDYVWAIRLGDLNNQPFSGELKAQLGRAVDWLWGMMDVTSGQAPNWGGNDGAMVLPLNNCGYSDMRPTVQAGYAVLLGERRLCGGTWDEDMVWLQGLGATRWPKTDVAVPSLSGGESGCHVLRNADGCVFVHCPVRFRHRPAHADVLHVDLWWRGQNLAQDPGSFSYNATPWDRMLAGTHAHNTLTVDGIDQMERVSPFIRLPWPRGRAWLGRSFSDSGLTCWEGTHNAYQRLADPVWHKRAVIELGGRGWLVLDSAAGKEDHKFQIHWLLADLTWSWETLPSRLRLDGRDGAYWVAVGCNRATATWKVGEETGDATGGYASRHYYEKRKAPTLRGEVRAASVIYATVFSPAPLVVYCESGRVGVRWAEETVHIELGNAACEPLVQTAVLNST